MRKSIRNAPNPQGIVRGDVVTWYSPVTEKHYTGVTLDVIRGEGHEYLGVTVRKLDSGCIINVPGQFVEKVSA